METVNLLQIAKRLLSLVRAAYGESNINGEHASWPYNYNVTTEHKPYH